MQRPMCWAGLVTTSGGLAQLQVPFLRLPRMCSAWGRDQRPPHPAGGLFILWASPMPRWLALARERGICACAAQAPVPCTLHRAFGGQSRFLLLISWRWRIACVAGLLRCNRRVVIPTALAVWVRKRAHRMACWHPGGQARPSRKAAETPPSPDKAHGNRLSIPSMPHGGIPGSGPNRA